MRKKLNALSSLSRNFPQLLGFIKYLLCSILLCINSFCAFVSSKDYKLTIKDHTCLLPVSYCRKVAAVIPEFGACGVLFFVIVPLYGANFVRPLLLSCCFYSVAVGSMAN